MHLQADHRLIARDVLRELEDADVDLAHSEILEGARLGDEVERTQLEKAGQLQALQPAAPVAGGAAMGVTGSF